MVTPPHSRHSWKLLRSVQLECSARLEWLVWGLVWSGGLVVISAHLKYALWRIRWAIYVCLASTDPHTWIYLAALLHTISYYRVLYTRICRLLVGQLCGCCRRSSVAWSGEQAEHVCMPHGLAACLPLGLVMYADMEVSHSHWCLD